MRLDLASIGACPTCRGALALDDAWHCQGCSTRWPIVGGIPRFVDSEHYVKSFGYQWRRYRRSMLDSATRRLAEIEFSEKTGLHPEEVKGKLVLDVGVGMGRLADVVARWGGTVVGLDLSLAVESARKNLAPHGENALVLQADLFKPPLRERTFDLVYSIGVLHHTPSTREAFRSIARLVKPGGRLSVGLYEHQDGYEEFRRFGARYRRYTTAMSHSFLFLLSHLAIPAYELLAAVRLAFGDELANRLHWALFIYMHEDPQWRVLNTFDWYAPRYQWVHDETEVRGWFEELGFEPAPRLPDRTMVCMHGRLAGELRVPPPSIEARRNALLPLDVELPRTPMLRDLLLGAHAARELAAALREVVGGEVARNAETLATPVRGLITSAVVSAKSAAGIKGDLGKRAPAPTGSSRDTR